MPTEPMEPPARMSDPDARECRCNTCDHTDWVGGPITPTIGIVSDVCRRDPCPECGGTMQPTHPFVRREYERGATNAD